MKILGEEFGEIGRWYIALPPLLLIGFLVGLFFLAAAGQSRLNTANERVHDSQLRQQALSEFIALISDAESGQRGYLLTGESSYLQPYTEAVAKVEAALDRVHEAYGGNDDSREFQELRILTGKKLGELEDTLALFKKRGTTPAVNVVRTDVGKHTMDEISRIVGDMRLAEAHELSAATAQWQADFQVSRWVSAAGVILNIGLVLLATHLVYGDMLVAARMDLSWLQQRLPTSDPAIEQRFKRIHESLSSGVDLKRRVVEELRPTLLDNMGLFTALRWQFKETCRRAGLRCTETIPDSEPKFNPDAAIGVFRIAQEALTNILKHAEAKSADLVIGMDGDTFVLRVSDDGKGIPSNRLQTITSHGLASMRHRITALGGSWEVRSPTAGGTIVTAVIPLPKMLVTEPA